MRRTRAGSPVAWILLGLVAVSALVIGALRAGGASTPEERIDAIARTVKCPVCPGESVYESRNSVALNIKADIAREVRAGQTDDQIRAGLSARYGDSVLLVPRADGIGAAVWVLPGGGPRRRGGRAGAGLPALAARDRRRHRPTRTARSSSRPSVERPVAGAAERAGERADSSSAAAGAVTRHRRHATPTGWPSWRTSAASCSPRSRTSSASTRPATSTTPTTQTLKDGYTGARRGRPPGHRRGPPRAARPARDGSGAASPSPSARWPSSRSASACWWPTSPASGSRARPCPGGSPRTPTAAWRRPAPSSAPTRRVRSLLYEAVKEVDPDNVEATTYLGWLLSIQAANTGSADSIAQAEGLLDDAIALDPQRADALLLQGGRALPVPRRTPPRRAPRSTSARRCTRRPRSRGLVQGLSEEIDAALAGGAPPTTASAAGHDRRHHHGARRPRLVADAVPAAGQGR